MMFWYDHDMGWWGYAGMGVGVLLFWGLLTVGIVALIRFSFSNSTTTANPVAPPQMPQTPAPEQVLAERFARGEIDETEYQQRIAVLRQHPHR